MTLGDLMRMGRPVGTLPTGAVEATVFSTDSARFLKPGAQCLAGSVKPDRSVVRCDAEVTRNFMKGLISKLYPQKDLAVFVLQSIGHVFDTATHLSKQFRIINHSDCFGLVGQMFLEKSRSSPATIVVNEQVAEKLVKPRHDLFFVTNGRGFGDCSQKRCLKQIFCVSPATQPPLQKG